MKKLLIIPLIFFCGLISAQIYTPLNPTEYGHNANRTFTRYALHIPEKEGLSTNTNDTSAQIFYNKLDSALWMWSQALGYVRIGNGGISGGGGGGGRGLDSIRASFDSLHYIEWFQGIPFDSFPSLIKNLQGGGCMRVVDSAGKVWIYNECGSGGGSDGLSFTANLLIFTNTLTPTGVLANAAAFRSALTANGPGDNNDSVTINNFRIVDGSGAGEVGLIEISISRLFVIPSGMFRNNTEITGFEDLASMLSEGSEIRQAAFRGATNLKFFSSILFGDISSSNVGDSAFYGCTSLQSIYLPAWNASDNTTIFKNDAALNNITVRKSGDAVRAIETTNGFTANILANVNFGTVNDSRLLFSANGLVKDTSNLIYDRTNGNIGIGISPTEKLDVNGQLKIGAGNNSSIYSRGDAGQLAIFATETPVKGAYILLNAANPAAFPDSGSLLLNYGDYTAVAPTNSLLRFRYVSNGKAFDNLSANANGFVGINTNSAHNALSAEPRRYSVGQASSVGYIITGYGTAWTADMVGDYLKWPSNTYAADRIIAVNSPTELVVAGESPVGPALSSNYDILRIGMQVTSKGNVGIGIKIPDSSAMLDITSTNRGLLVPRMTTANRTAIVAPANGLLVYDTDINSLFQRSGGSWQDLYNSGGSGGVSAVSGTVNRVTSTGGTTPVIDISSTFENLLLKKTDSATIYATRFDLSGKVDTLSAIKIDTTGIANNDGVQWSTTKFVKYTRIPTWNLNGNAALSRTLNYAGSSDTSEYHIKQNGIDAITVDSLRRIGIGTIDPAYTLDIAKLGTGATAPQINVFGYGTGTSAGGYLILGGSAGTVIGSLAATPTGKVMGSLEYYSVNSSSGLTSSAKIQSIQLGSAGATFNAARLGLFTGTSLAVPTERLSIDSLGNVGVGTITPNALAILDLTSTLKGILIPRWTTTQMNAIASPPDGLTGYNTDSSSWFFYNGPATAWYNLRGLGASGTVITGGAQSFSGIKTFSNGIVAGTISTNATAAASNFAASSGQALGGATSTVQLKSSANNVQYRVVMRGATATTATASTDVWNTIVGDGNYTEPGSGTAIESGGLFIATQTLVDGAGATTNFENVRIGDAPTSTATNNYALNTGLIYHRTKDVFDATITAGGTTGNQTINKPTGTVNIAAAGTTVTVTNSLCTTSSIVRVVIRTNDATAWLKNVVPGSGSFVINLGAAATAEVSLGFEVIN